MTYGGWFLLLCQLGKCLTPSQCFLLLVDGISLCGENSAEKQALQRKVYFYE